MNKYQMMNKYKKREFSKEELKIIRIALGIQIRAIPYSNQWYKPEQNIMLCRLVKKIDKMTKTPILDHSACRVCPIQALSERFFSGKVTKKWIGDKACELVESMGDIAWVASSNKHEKAKDFICSLLRK